MPGVKRPMTSRSLTLQARYQLIFCSPRVNFCVQVTFPPHILVPLSTSAHALLAPRSASLEFLAIAQVASQTVKVLFNFWPTFQHRNGDCGHQRTPFAAEAADERAQGRCIQYAIAPFLYLFDISLLTLYQQFHHPKTATSPNTLPRVMVAEVSKPLHLILRRHAYGRPFFNRRVHFRLFWLGRHCGDFFDTSVAIHRRTILQPGCEAA